MAGVVYTSRARIEPVRGPIRRAYLGAAPDPVVYGAQSELLAWHTAPAEKQDTASTPDTIVAAVGA